MISQSINVYMGSGRVVSCYIREGVCVRAFETALLLMHDDSKPDLLIQPLFVCPGGDATGLLRTGQYVSDLFQSGALTCLICIASVKRTQPVRHSISAATDYYFFL